MVSLRRMSIVAMTAVAAVALAACTSQGGDSATETPTSDGIVVGQFGGEQLAIGEPVEGGEFTYGLLGPVAALDPAGTMGDSILATMAAVYGTLMKVEPDGSVAADLAESFTTTDNVVWTLVLPDGLTFTDGTPFDAQAVIEQQVNVAAEGSTSTSARDARQIVDMNALDSQTVQFTLEAPNNQFDLLFTDGSMGMIPSPTAKAAAGDSFATNPVGAGPFMVEAFTPNREITLVKNPDYKYASEGLPYLDKVRLVTVQDQTSRVSGVLSGDLDAATVGSIPILDEARSQGLIGLREPVYEAYYLIINNQDDILSDIRVRTALNQAIDREAVNEVVYEGAHEPMTGLLVPSHPYAEYNIDWPLFDEAGATALMDEYRADTGVGDIALEVMITPGENSSQIAPLVQQMLEPLGIDMTIAPTDPSAQVGRFAAGDFQAALITRSIPGETTTALQQYFEAGSTRNWSQVDIPEYNELIAETGAATTTEERLAKIPDLLAVLTENVVTVPIVSSGMGRVIGPDVAGFPDGNPNSRSIDRFDLSRVWMKQQ